MNFKITLWKSITSIVVGLILGYFIRAYALYLIRGIGWQNAASPISLYLFIVGTIFLIYIIWSLIQKKK